LFKKLEDSISKIYRQATPWQLFLFFFALAFFIRFPFFFRDYIDRDESTFILMGQAWADGFLPYTQLWDLKPPITFLFFAGTISFFGKSFFAIRLGGTFVVALTAFLTHKIGSGIKTKKVGFWSAVMVVLLQSLFGSVQGVMSEHLSTLFFVAALYVLLTKDKRFHLLLSGVLLGLALMTKLNMGYAVLLVFLCHGWFGFRAKKWWGTISSLFVMGLAVVFVIAATALPYYFQGNLLLWWRSVFEAPLAYSDAKSHSIFKVLPSALVIVGLMGWAFSKNLLDRGSQQIQLLVTAIIGILVSFVQVGKINGHYLLQLYPFLVLLIAVSCANIKTKRSFRYKPLVFFILLLLPMEAYLEYANIVKSKLQTGSFYNGEGILVPHYFKNHDIKPENILFLEYHIGYWLLNASPPTKAATHPSNIMREELFPYMQNPRNSRGDEIRHIVEALRPSHIVTRKHRRVFDRKMKRENFYINLALATYYHPKDTLGNAVIHQRLELD